MNDYKQKAIELVNKYLRVEDDTTFYWEPCYDRRYLDDEVFQHAKKCALIAVDEIILSNPHSNPFNNWHIKSTMDYWQQVKTEIENL